MMEVNYSYLRPQKARILKEAYEKFKLVDEIGVEEYEDATILPLKKFEGDNLLFGRAGVVDKNGEYVSNSAIPRRVEGHYDYESNNISDEVVVYCGYLVKHWGHFLIEAVARLWYFVEKDNECIDKYVFVVDSEAELEISNNYKEFLVLLGVWDKLELINVPTTYKKVLVPELAYKYNACYTKQYKEIFEKVIENALKCNVGIVYCDKVFLSRSRFPKAQKTEAGLELLDHYFKKNGFDIIFPENVSLTKLIHILQNAKECAMESGTTPHNILFGYDGQKITIIERQTIINHVQANIDCIRDLSITYVDGHYTIYPVTAGGGPYILAYNKWFEKYTFENKMISPEKFFGGGYQKYLKKCLNHYMKEYKKAYYQSWGMEDWQINYADSIYEAYVESYSVLSDYLNGQKMYCGRQILEIRFWKQFIKKNTKKDSILDKVIKKVMNNMEITFETKCWEKDWEVLLKTD